MNVQFIQDLHELTHKEFMHTYQAPFALTRFFEARAVSAQAYLKSKGVKCLSHGSNAGAHSIITSVADIVTEIYIWVPTGTTMEANLNVSAGSFGTLELDGAGTAAPALFHVKGLAIPGGQWDVVPTGAGAIFHYVLGYTPA